MRHLVFTNTPAHVHLYRNAVTALLDRGHEVRILARDYGCTLALLEWYDLPHEVYGRKGNAAWGLAPRLPGQFLTIARRARQFDPDLIFGRGGYAAVAKLATGRPTVLLLDSVPWKLGVSLPAAVVDYVVTTNAFAHDLGPDHYRFHGLTECAYLHPDRFSPDPSVRAELGVDADERYAIVRFNAFDSLHDVGESGFTPVQRRAVVEGLAEHLTVFVSDESGTLDLAALPAREYDLHPARVHDALAEASLFVADTGTMVTEAALVGTPAVRASPAAGEDDLGEFVELHEAGLVRNVRPEIAAETAVDLAADEWAPDRWEQRRAAFLGERCDLTSLVIDIAESPDAVPVLVGGSDERTGGRDHPGDRWPRDEVGAVEN